MIIRKNSLWKKVRVLVAISTCTYLTTSLRGEQGVFLQIIILFKNKTNYKGL